MLAWRSLHTPGVIILMTILLVVMLLIFIFGLSMIICTDLSSKTSVTDASLSAALNAKSARKENLPLWYGATSLLTLPSPSGARSVPGVARFLEALTTSCGVMPHLVYSQPLGNRCRRWCCWLWPRDLRLWP